MPIRQTLWIFESPQGPVIGLENIFPRHCFMQAPLKVEVNTLYQVCTIHTSVETESGPLEVAMIRAEVCGVEIMVGQPLNLTIPRAAC